MEAEVSATTRKRPMNPTYQKNQCPKYLTPVALFQPSPPVLSILAEVADV